MKELGREGSATLRLVEGTITGRLTLDTVVAQIELSLDGADVMVCDLGWLDVISLIRGLKSVHEGAKRSPQDHDLWVEVDRLSQP